MLWSTESAKHPVPGNAYRGMPSSDATEAVHGSNKSETIASGGSDRTNWLNRACSRARTRENCSDSDLSGKVSVDSQFGGKREVEGNGRTWRSIGWLRDCERAMVDRKWSALRGVTTMVDVTPRAAKILAMSIMGMMWPGDGKGTKRTLRGFVSSDIVCVCS